MLTIILHLHKLWEGCVSNWYLWGIFIPPAESFSWSSGNKLQKPGLRSGIWKLSWHSSKAIIAPGLALSEKMLLKLCPKQDWVSFIVSKGVLAEAQAVWDMCSARALAFSPERNVTILDYKQINGMKIMRRVLLMKSALHNAVLVSCFQIHVTWLFPHYLLFWFIRRDCSWGYAHAGSGTYIRTWR